MPPTPPPRPSISRNKEKGVSPAKFRSAIASSRTDSSDVLQDVSVSKGDGADDDPKYQLPAVWLSNSTSPVLDSKDMMRDHSESFCGSGGDCGGVRATTPSMTTTAAAPVVVNSWKGGWFRKRAMAPKKLFGFAVEGVAERRWLCSYAAGLLYYTDDSKQELRSRISLRYVVHVIGKYTSDRVVLVAHQWYTSPQNPYF